MIHSLVAMTGLESCLTSAYLQCLFYLGERAVVHGPLVIILVNLVVIYILFHAVKSTLYAY